MNFSLSKDWCYALTLRYPVDKIKQYGKLFFYEKDNILVCQHFFEFDTTKQELELLSKEIKDGKSIRFSYLNQNKLYNKILSWSKKNNYKVEVIDEWDNPLLIMKDSITMQDYLKNNSHTQVKRNYQKYIKYGNKYKYVFSDSSNRLELWSDVLKIDSDSWKKEENSDMKSLNREDLQYLPFLLKQENNSSLLVVYDGKEKPLAYSLMFKNYDSFWYAVKWGASNNGRENYVGIYCLIKHLEYLNQKEKDLKIDFWGRRNRVYDSLKNDSISRNHIVISNGVE